MVAIRLDPVSGRVVFEAGGSVTELPPLWLRERSEDPAEFDPVSHQRLYDPVDLPLDLAVTEVRAGEGNAMLAFSDGHRWTFDLNRLAVETGQAPDPDALPPQRPWTAEETPPPRVSWSECGTEAGMLRALRGFFRDGYVILTDTPTEEESLLTIAARFGPIRETHWGRLFNVRSIPNADDLAYTGVRLAAHTDNPYRRSVPGIQFLHCLENEAGGGESTLVDGCALAEALRAEAPDLFDVAAGLPISFRYEGPGVSDRMTAPMLILDEDGRLKHIRLSTRLDFPPAADPPVLERFFAARQRLSRLAADPRFERRFKLAPGDCLMMDNHRTLHGRTAFAETGRRFLQGCYIDHDVPESRFRVLSRRLGR